MRVFPARLRKPYFLESAAFLCPYLLFIRAFYLRRNRCLCSLCYQKPFAYPAFLAPYDKCTESELRGLTGTYQDAQGQFTLSVEARDGNLMAIMEGQPPVMLEAHTMDLFGNSTSQAVFEFQRAQGSVTLKQGPVELLFHRKLNKKP